MKIILNASCFSQNESFHLHKLFYASEYIICFGGFQCIIFDIQINLIYYNFPRFSPYEYILRFEISLVTFYCTIHAHNKLCQTVRCWVISSDYL